MWSSHHEAHRFCVASFSQVVGIWHEYYWILIFIENKEYKYRKHIQRGREREGDISTVYILACLYICENLVDIYQLHPHLFKVWYARFTWLTLLRWANAWDTKRRRQGPRSPKSHPFCHREKSIGSSRIPVSYNKCCHSSVANTLVKMDHLPLVRTHSTRSSHGSKENQGFELWGWLSSSNWLFLFQVPSWFSLAQVGNNSSWNYPPKFSYFTFTWTV